MEVLTSGKWAPRIVVDCPGVSQAGFPRNFTNKKGEKIDTTNFFFIMLLVEVTPIYEVSIQKPVSAEEFRRVSRSVSRIYKVFQQQKKRWK